MSLAESPTASNGLGPAARSGDRAALAELGRRGGTRRAERERERKATVVAEAVLETIDDWRALVRRCVALVEASNESATAKAGAIARLTSVHLALDDLPERAALAKENAALKAELDVLRARLGRDGGITLSWSDEEDEPPAEPDEGSQPLDESDGGR